ncbi:MAG: hypothetical protein ACE5FL_00415 [Myxococcota bacterium]
MVAPKPGRPEAAAVIWHPDHALTGTETARRARIRGAAQAAVGAAIAGALMFFFDARTLPFIMLGAAGVVFLSAMLSPKGVFSALENLLEAVAGRLGRVVMWISLATIFYVFFVPFGVLFRRGRHDRLKRFFEPDAESYWNWEPTKGPTAATSSLDSQY